MVDLETIIIIIGDVHLETMYTYNIKILRIFHSVTVLCGAYIAIGGSNGIKKTGDNNN